MPKPLFRSLEQKIRDTVLRVEYRDLTTLEADALVSSDDTDLSMSGGVSAALFFGPLA
jgi:O-acetyl-ADP-ribose deacetylase (regulator of RNase III)